MKHEIEVKLRLPVSAILEALTTAGIPFRIEVPRHFEDNWLLGGSDRRVPGKRAVLRIRKAHNSGTLTYKAEPPDGEQSSAYKIRTEIETSLADPETAIAIFGELGYRPWFRYQKFRTVYALDAPSGETLEIMADETPLGDFVELEGSEDAITSVIRLLEVEKDDYILDSYLALQIEACRARGKELEDLIFPENRIQPMAEAGRTQP